MNRCLIQGLVVWSGVFAILVARAAEPLTSATVTELRNNVSYRTKGATERPAKLGDVVKDEDVVRTGERSLAELEFNDKTITRIGSKSIFSFRTANREFEVARGMAVICVPKGSGGGQVRSPTITAAIQGTTVLVFNDDILFLEGTGIITTRDGKQSKPIQGGQIARMVNGVLTIFDVWIDPLMRSSLFTSRSQPLPTWAQVQEIATTQKEEIEHHRLTPDDDRKGPPDLDDTRTHGDAIQKLQHRCNCPPPYPGEGRGLRQAK